MPASSRDDQLREAVALLADRCPRLVATCYWAGTSAIALEELGHRESFDVDRHTQEPLVDTRPLLAELEGAFPGAVEVMSPPDRYGSGFTSVLMLSDGTKVPVQVFGGFEHVPDADLVQSSVAPKLRRISVRRYLLDKVQCVVERLEARDLVDINAVLRLRPRLAAVLERAVAEQDLLLLVERLLGWTNESIREDLRAYPDVDPSDAIGMRDRLLELASKAEGT